MPQYDVYEDPEPVAAAAPPSSPAPGQTSTRIPVGNVAPLDKHLATWVGEGIHKPSSSTTNKAAVENDENISPYHFHSRHSHLSRQASFEENPMIKASTYHEQASAGSPKILSPAEREQLAELERSQREDDDIRMMLASERQRQDEQQDQQQQQQQVVETLHKYPGERDPIKIIGSKTDLEDAEKHLLRGGWMHRSRANHEYLSDHKARNVGGE